MTPRQDQFLETLKSLVESFTGEERDFPQHVQALVDAYRNAGPVTWFAEGKLRKLVALAHDSIDIEARARYGDDPLIFVESMQLLLRQLQMGSE